MNRTIDKPCIIRMALSAPNLQKPQKMAPNPLKQQGRQEILQRAYLSFALRAAQKAPSGRHGPLEVLIDLVEEALGRQPLLVRADEQREVLRHEAVLDGLDAHPLEGRGESAELRITVELSAVGEA